MYYIKKILISSQNEDGEKVISTLDLAPGLNIIYGPSNTGKTLVLDCVDFMLGGEARRLYKPALRIMAVTMYLDVDGAEVRILYGRASGFTFSYSRYVPLHNNRSHVLVLGLSMTAFFQALVYILQLSGRHLG